MADVWEKDLAQKSSLTTSDFIRVVGTDNVSYKQPLSSVMRTMGVAVYDYTQSSGSFLDWVLSNFTTNGDYYVVMGSSNTTDWPSTVTGTCIVQKRNANYFLFATVGDSMVSGNQTIWLNRYINNSWVGWSKMPTRAEINALNSNSLTNYTQDGSYTTSKVVNIPATPKMLLVYAYGGSGDNAVFFVNSFSSSNVEPRILMIGSGFTHSYDNSTRKLTIVRNNGNTFSISTFNA